MNDNGNITVTKRNDISYAIMFHYVDDKEKANKIAQDKKLIPNCDLEYTMINLYNPDNEKPRINLTDIRPEEGRNSIAAATCLNPNYINYGLELLVEVDKSVQKIPGLHRAYQIFTEEPIETKILKIRNIDRLERKLVLGYEIHRSIGPKGGVYSFLKPPQK